jgi:hypothetical protein
MDSVGTSETSTSRLHSSISQKAIIFIVRYDCYTPALRYIVLDVRDTENKLMKEVKEIIQHIYATPEEVLCHILITTQKLQIFSCSLKTNRFQFKTDDFPAVSHVLIQKN